MSDYSHARGQIPYWSRVWEAFFTHRHKNRGNLLPIDQTSAGMGAASPIYLASSSDRWALQRKPQCGARPPLQSSRSRICNSFSPLQSHIHLQSSTPQAAINPSSHTYADGCPDSLDPSSPVMAPSVSPPSSPPTPNPQSTCSTTPHPPGPLLTPRRRGLGCRGSRRPHQI